MDGEFLAVHGVRQQRTCSPELPDLHAALEIRLAILAVYLSTVRPAEHHLPRASLHPGQVQHLGERDTGPLRGAHRAQAPWLSGDRWLKPGAAVAGALQRDDRARRSHCPQLSKAERKWPLDQPAHVQPPADRIEVGDAEVVT